MKTPVTINPTPAQMVDRHIGRIKTLRAAIVEAKAKNNDARVKSLTEELDRRLEAVDEFKAQLEAI